MAFQLAGNTITQTGTYFTVTVTAITANTGGCTLTVSTGGTIQAGATVADCIGRLVVNNTKLQLAPNTAANLREWAFVDSISSVAANTTGITLTLDRYFLSGTNGEEAFSVSVGDQLAIAQCEDDLIAAGLAGVISQRSTLNYAGVTGVRTDIDWSNSPTTQLFLGNTAQGLQLIVNGFFGIRGNTQVYQGANLAGTEVGNTALSIGPAAAFSLGRASTAFVGGVANTSLVYPTVSWTIDQRSVSHWGQGTVANNGGLMLLMGSYGGVAATVTSFYGNNPNTTNANTRMHYRKCRIWSAGTTSAQNVVPNIFGRYGYTTFDECEMYGTQGLQREGSTHRIYSIANTGAGISQAGNNSSPPFIVNGYRNSGSFNGLDFRVYRGSLSGGSETTNTANMIISKDSPAGTNLYLGSADDAFFAGGQQNGNLEMKRNLNFVHTGANTNSVTYFKDVTRALGTVGSAAVNIANQRGSTSGGSTQDGTAATTGQSITATRNGTVVASDNIALQNDRTYVQANSSSANVLIGEIYTTTSAINTYANQNTIGRPGYDGGASGIATNRVSRRGKDDTQGSRLNRDNYDLYTWSYTGQFSKISDYSMNAGANGQAGTVGVGLLADLNLTVTNPTTVAGYTDVSTGDKLYDYAKYYKTATTTLNGRTLQQRLELGGVDGTTPTTTVANGGGGYLAYIDTNNNISFNDIFSSFTISGGTNANPFNVAAGIQGPVQGTWNGTTYSYGDCVPAVPTTQGVLTMYAGTANAIADTRTLDFGSRNVSLVNQPTVAGNWAPLKTTGTIQLGGTVGGTNAQIRFNAGNGTSGLGVALTGAVTVAVVFTFTGQTGSNLPSSSVSFAVTTTATTTIGPAAIAAGLAGVGGTFGTATISANQGFSTATWANAGWTDSTTGTGASAVVIVNGPQASQWTTPPTGFTLTSTAGTVSGTANASYGTLTNGIAPTAVSGTTNYQSLSYSNLTGLPTSGLISNSGALLGGTWSVSLTASSIPNTAIVGSTSLSGVNLWTMQNTNTSLVYVLNNFVDNSIIGITGPAGATGNRLITLNSCSFASGKTVTINYTRGAGSTDTLQIALQGTPTASVIAGTNAVKVNSVTVTLDATSQGGNIVLLDSGNNILNTTTALSTTQTSQTLIFSGTAVRAIVGNANNTTAYVPRVFSSAQILTGALDASAMTATIAAPLSDADTFGWTTAYASGETTFLVAQDSTTQGSALAGIRTAGRIVRRFGDVPFLQGLGAALLSGHSQSDFITNINSETCSVATYLLQFDSSVNTIQRTIGGVSYAGLNWYDSTGTLQSLTSGLVGYTGLAQVAVPLSNQSAAFGDVLAAEKQLIDTDIIPNLTAIDTHIADASLLIPTDVTVPVNVALVGASGTSGGTPPVEPQQFQPLTYHTHNDDVIFDISLMYIGGFSGFLHLVMNEHLRGQNLGVSQLPVITLAGEGRSGIYTFTISQEASWKIILVIDVDGSVVSYNLEGSYEYQGVDFRPQGTITSTGGSL